MKKKKLQNEQNEFPDFKKLQNDFPDFKTYMMIEVGDHIFQMVNKNLKIYLQGVYEKYDNDEIKSLEFIDQFLEHSDRNIKRDDTNLFLEQCFCLWMKGNNKIKIIY